MSSVPNSAEPIIRRYYETFNSGDRAAFLDLLAENVVHKINQGGREVGKEAFGRFLERMDRCYAEQVKDLVVFTSDGAERGAAEFRIEGKYLAADEGLPEAKGQTYDLRVGAFFELNAGLVTRITNYYNLQDWLNQVGA